MLSRRVFGVIIILGTMLIWVLVCLRHWMVGPQRTAPSWSRSGMAGMIGRVSSTRPSLLIVPANITIRCISSWEACVQTQTLICTMYRGTRRTPAASSWLDWRTLWLSTTERVWCGGSACTGFLRTPAPPLIHPMTRMCLAPTPGPWLMITWAAVTRVNHISEFSRWPAARLESSRVLMVSVSGAGAVMYHRYTTGVAWFMLLKLQSCILHESIYQCSQHY